MKASRRNTEPEQRSGEYALRRGLGTWEVTFDGRRDSFRDEQGSEYVAWLLLHPPPQPIHATALVLEAQRVIYGSTCCFRRAGTWGMAGRGRGRRFPAASLTSRRRGWYGGGTEECGGGVRNLELREFLQSRRNPLGMRRMFK
jgi:hypothetical protein